MYIGEAIGQPQVDGTPNCSAQSDCTNDTVNATVKCVATNNGHNVGTTSGKCTVSCAQDSDCGPDQICNLGNNGGTAGNSNYLVGSSTAVGVCYFANYEPTPLSTPAPGSNWQLSANGGQAQMCIPEATPIPGGFPEGHSCTQHSDCGSFNCYDTTLAQQCTPGDANCKCGALFTWSGNFWGRTNCSLASGQLTCDTGNCGGANGTAQRLDCNGNSSLTVQGPQNPQNLAEYTLLSPTYGTEVQDNYDNSMVNGFNVGMEAAPVTGTFSGTPAKGYCSSPGQGCSFDLLSTCPDVLKYENGSSTLVGCWAPTQACTQGTPSQQTMLGCTSQVPFLCTQNSDCPYNASGSQTMTCNKTAGQAFGQCTCATSADCPANSNGTSFTCSGSPSTCVTSSGANWVDLYGCGNFYNLSPYNSHTTTTKDVGIVCGCPSWSSPPGECITHNINWEQVPSGSTSPVASPAPTTSTNDLYLIFHNACATAYTYAYDDNSGTIGCAPASGAQVGPSYNITYCPQSSGPTATATPTSTSTGGGTPTPTSTSTGGGTPTPTATSSGGPTGTPTTGPTPTVTATATPQPSGIATPISQGSGSFAPGATADLGSFGYTSTSTNPQVVQSVSLSVSKPKIFSSITVTASIGGTQVGTATVSSPDIDKTTIFTFEEPIDVAAGASVTFAISGVISGGGSGQLELQRQVRLAAIIPVGDRGGPGGTGRLMLALSLLGLVIAPLTSSKRRRNSAILAAVILVLATGIVGCGSSSSSSSSSTSGTSKQDVVAMSVTELGNEIDVAGIPISLGQVTKQ